MTKVTEMKAGMWSLSIRRSSGLKSKKQKKEKTTGTATSLLTFRTKRMAMETIIARLVWMNLFPEVLFSAMEPL